MLSFFLLQVVISLGNSPVVTVTEGQLQGVEQFSREGNPFYAFLGIPYASVSSRFEVGRKSVFKFAFCILYF